MTARSMPGTGFSVEMYCTLCKKVLFLIFERTFRSWVMNSEIVRCKDVSAKFNNQAIANLINFCQFYPAFSDQIDLLPGIYCICQAKICWLRILCVKAG